jgi:hypothetical protein
MKSVLMAILILVVASCVFAQGGNVTYQASGTTVSIGAVQKMSATPITGAPYSGTITNEMTRTLEDGTHIVQTTNGSVARDSEGRTRQDAPLPAIGNLSAANAPHIVFLQDPVAHVTYTLDLTEKTAQKMSMPGQVPDASEVPAVAIGAAGGSGEGPVFAMRVQNGPVTAPSGGTPSPLPPLPPATGVIMMQKLVSDDPALVTTEDLGSQTMQGVMVTGTRSTRVIPKGQIGNDAPLSIVNEVWTSSELRTVIYSKRSDPRMGVQTFQLTNISRTEPDSSLFTVPADFKVVDGPQPIIYRTK